MKEPQSKKVIDVVNHLTDSGEMEILYGSGLLTSKAIMYRAMYLKFQAYLLQGFSRTKAARMVADHFRYEDIRTVYRAIQIMSTEAE